MMEKNCIKICSDPYKKHIYYYWYEEDGSWNDMEEMDDSPLNDKRFISLPISHNAYDMLKIITEKLYNPTVGLKLIFEGTDDDFADLSSVRELYYSEYDIDLERGIKIMKPAKEVMPQIEDSYSKLKKFFEEYPDPNTEAVVNKYTDAVKPEIALCVMGLYSSGKSAFINSLIGREILPSDSDPATAKIYKIREADKHLIVFRFQGEEFRIEFGKKKWKANKNPNSEIVKLISETIAKHSPESEDQYLYWTLYALNEFAKKEGRERHDELVTCAEKHLSGAELKTIKNDEEKIECLLRKHRIKDLLRKKELTPNKLDDVIEVYVSFHSSYLPLGKFKFVIYDTPGSNSVMFREHADILKDSLEQQTNGLPIFVTNPDSMDETDNNDIMSIINEMGGALDVSNMMLVVNKSDEKPGSTLKKKIENKDNLVLTKWKASRVYFVSSIVGLGGKKDNPESEDEWIDEEYYAIFIEKMTKFEDPNSRLYLRLFEYNIIPKDAQERISKRIESIGKEELLLWNSGIPCVEEEIGIFAQKYALYNKCSQAVQYLVEAVKLVEEDVCEAETKAEGIRKSVKDKLDKKKQALIEKLQKECDSKKKEFTTGFANNTEIQKVVSKYLDKERIRKIVEKALNSSPGKTNFEKLNPFSKEIEKNLQSDMKAYSDEASKITGDYWEKRAGELREILMRIVVNSDALTDEEKEILKKVLLKVKNVSSAHKALNIENTTAVEKKGKKFLWIWDLTKINRTKSQDKYYDSLKGDISESNRKVTVENERSFDDWVKQLINELGSVVSSFNPELVELTKALNEQIGIINAKRKQQEYIAEQIDTIESLMDFEEV